MKVCSRGSVGIFSATPALLTNMQFMKTEETLNLDALMLLIVYAEI